MSEETIKVHVVDYGRANLVMRYLDPMTKRQVSRSTGTANRKEAEKAAAKWEAELNEGRYVPPAKTTWEAFRERYEKEVLPGFARQTWGKVSSVFNTVEEILRPQRLRDLTAGSISRYQAKLREMGRSENTIASHLGTLGAALRWAVKVGLIPTAPRIDRPRRATKAKRGSVMKGRPITGEEFDRMIDAVPRVVLPKRKEGARPLTPDQEARRVRVVESWRRYLRGLWLSGLRLEESLELFWDRPDRLSVDLTGSESGGFPMLRIPASLEKGNKDRLLSITPDFMEFLLATPRAERRGPVFPIETLRGPVRRLDTRYVSSVVSDIGEAAGVKVASKMKKDPKTGKEVEKVKFASAHDLRRSFGERWARRVLPIVLQELMRHESIETTLRYYVGTNAKLTAQAVWESVNAALPKLEGQEGNTLGNTTPTEAKNGCDPKAATVDPEKVSVKLPGMDSNHERGIQNPLCYHYTTG